MQTFLNQTGLIFYKTIQLDSGTHSSLMSKTLILTTSKFASTLSMYLSVKASNPTNLTL